MVVKKISQTLLKNMKWYDFSLLKLSVFFFTLFLITFWDGFRIFILKIDWLIYLILFIIVSIPIFKKML